MTGQSAEAKRVADDGAWRVLYGAVCRDRHVDAAHRHVLCTPDMIFTSWSSWRPPSETRNGPHRPGSIPGRVASNCSGRSRCRCRCRDHDRDVDRDCALCHAHVPDSGASRGLSSAAEQTELVWQNRTARVAGWDRYGRLVTLDQCGA